MRVALFISHQLSQMELPEENSVSPGPGLPSCLLYVCVEAICQKPSNIVELDRSGVLSAVPTIDQDLRQVCDIACSRYELRTTLTSRMSFAVPRHGQGNKTSCTRGVIIKRPLQSHLDPLPHSRLDLHKGDSFRCAEVEFEVESIFEIRHALARCKRARMSPVN